MSTALAVSPIDAHLRELRAAVDLLHAYMDIYGGILPPDVVASVRRVETLANRALMRFSHDEQVSRAVRVLLGEITGMLPAEG